MADGQYFAAGTGADGQQLWIVTVSGQTVTAHELAVLYPATAAVVPNGSGGYVLGTQPNDGAPTQFTSFGGGTLFVASGLHTGRELFFSDGTAGGTRLVRDINPAFDSASYRSHGIRYNKITNVQSSEPVEITAVGASRAVFTASDGTNQLLFTTDGTEAGTTAITAGGLVGAQFITAFGEQALFAGSNGTAVGLWITDGTDAGTRAIAGPSYPGQTGLGALGTDGSGFAVVATAAGGVEAFFAGGSSAGGIELWATDGTDAGTRQVADIAAGTASSGAAFVTGLGEGRAIFTADDGVNGRQLWVTDGTQAGTTLVKTIGVDPFKFSSGFTTATIGGQQKAFFVGYDKVDDTTPSTIDPWVTDGTAAGTVRLLDFTNAYAGNFTAFGGRVFFTANDRTHGRELWVTDGTAAGTTLFDDLNAADGSSPHDLKVLGGQLLFTADDGAGDKLFVSDGTAAGTHAVSNPPPISLGTAAADPVPCFVRGTRLLGPDGPVTVEDLREGDLLLTASGQAVPVVWIGEREVDCRHHPAPEKIWPVRVGAGAFGPSVPARDVVLSPDHAVLVDDVLIPVGRLANCYSIAQERVDSVHYFHVELPLHDVLLAEGLPVESFLDTGNRRMFAGQPAIALHPDFARLDWEKACAPLVLTGPVLDRAAARLRARSVEPLVRVA